MVIPYETRVELVPALSELARIYYEEPHRICFTAGICYNLLELTKVEGAYHKISCVMRELGYNQYEYFEGPEPTTYMSIEDWEQRAIMCLILSEYLYHWKLEEEPIELEPEPKTFFQKVKDKLKSILIKEGGIVTSKTN